MASSPSLSPHNMEFSVPKSSILVASVLLLVSGISRGAMAGSMLIDGVCKQTTDSAKCSKILGSDSRAESAKELKDLAKVALDLAISNAKATITLIRKMVADKPCRSSGEIQALKQCAFWYKGVVDSFKSGHLELKKDVQSANYDVLIAGDDANNCEKELSSDRARIPLISEKNAEAMLFNNLAGVIADGLGG